jgi:hypothetical protein
MHRWSADTYPFGCARESSQRKGCREVVYELFAAIYPDYMLEGVAHGDVAMAIAKTAAALYNDDPMHKRMVQGTLNSMTLAQGMPFEKGVKALWERADDLESMNVPVLGGLQGEARDKLKKELLYGYIYDNPDYKEVINDFYRYNYDYNTMYSQCVMLQQRLQTRQASSHRGGEGHGRRRHEHGRLAVETERPQAEEDPRSQMLSVRRPGEMVGTRRCRISKASS